MRSSSSPRVNLSLGIADEDIVVFDDIHNALGKARARRRCKAVGNRMNSGFSSHGIPDLCDFPSDSACNALVG